MSCKIVSNKRQNKDINYEITSFKYLILCFSHNKENFRVDFKIVREIVKTKLKGF